MSKTDEKIRCLECGQAYLNIKKHVNSYHGISMKTYLDRHPEARNINSPPEPQSLPPGLKKKDIKKLGYLADIFANNPDDLKWLSDTYDRYMKEWELETETDRGVLLRLLSLELRDQQLIRIEQSSTQASKRSSNSKVRRENLDRILDLQKALNMTKEQRDKRRKVGGESAAEIVQDVDKVAFEYIKAHPEMFTWKCGYCSRLNLLNMPHWAFDENNVPWSEEGMKLVEKGLMDISHLALILRTSPAHLHRMAEKRGFKLPPLGNYRYQDMQELIADERETAAH